jgi:uncharacterized membrane protein
MIPNGPQLHLMLNHMPVVGFILLTPILLLVALRGDARLQKLALMGAFAVSLLALPAYWTGEPAEDGIEHLPGVSKHLIHEHEEAAEKALVLSILTGVLALGGLFSGRGSESKLKVAVNIVLAASVLTSLAMAKAGHEGGKIRHPEITTADPATNDPASLKTEDHKDEDRD